MSLREQIKDRNPLGIVFVDLPTWVAVLTAAEVPADAELRVKLEDLRRGAERAGNVPEVGVQAGDVAFVLAQQPTGGGEA